MKKSRLTLAGLILCFLLPSAGSAGAISGQEILGRVDANLQPGDLEMYRKIINIEPNGRTKEYVLWFLKKDNDKVVTLFVSPASEQGRATLRQGDNRWLLIPNVGKPIRITSLQSVVGGVFNNADIMRLDFGVEYEATNLGQDQGNTCWISRPRAVAWLTTASICGCSRTRLSPPGSIATPRPACSSKRCISRK
jgi:hypothetical protein